MTDDEPMRYRVAVIPGDDAAPEAVAATLDVVTALRAPVDWSTVEGLDGESVVEAAGVADGVLFGSTNGRTGGIAHLRWGLGTFANVRPIRQRPGVPSALTGTEPIDYVIVRENLEDLYCGLEGDLGELFASSLRMTMPLGAVRPRYPLENSSSGRYAIKVVTEEVTTLVSRFAFDLAVRRRDRGHLGRVTVGAKWNVLPGSDGFFRDVVRSVAVDYPEIELVERLADDLARRIVASPGELDVVLLPNLYGDILSDAAAATVGGLGVAPSGCYGVDTAYFEPVHGTAPDIAGCHSINPAATILSAAMLLDHLGLASDALRLERAVDQAFEAGDRLTPDLGGQASTEAFAEAVIDRL